VAIEAPREERKWYQMPAFWLGIMAGAVLALVLTAGGQKPAPQQTAPVEQSEPVIERAPLKPQVQPVDPSAEPAVAPAEGQTETAPATAPAQEAATP
ncbi:MAG TPA: hypothetical protein PLN53_07000, partial [Terricaulis sp.]|nr:hypothetical protein [Terricaulis sp.]